MNEVRASLGFKGENGLSAYEVAVKNGYVGSEQDWLATLGTSSHLTHETEIYTTTEVDEDTFDLPAEYTSNSYVEVYVNGLKLDSGEYTIDTDENTVTLSTPLEVIGTKVEVELTDMSTNNLPITSTISSTSTNTTAAGTKSVYDALNLKANKYTVTELAFNVSANSTTTVDFPYPTGHDDRDTIIIGKSLTIGSQSGDGYYESYDENSVFISNPTIIIPMIKTIYYKRDYVRVVIKNNSEESNSGYVRLAYMCM